ncbi:histidine kinase N-terminal 7TM domain-containing protein [Natrialba sp. INN-245]|uniref:histidine kinase N-terminal 7TM domain-containing protein n=1 Tax=Natrialba sp. INN-245 TaxID=2690967 RepID=UPI001310ACF3|nr:histidine kinase N-terminal 7TM domain-containing protein [Natrialba sp. INN-245]MWV39295.1 PAS domain-containing protein [Natrialba sp. INN-245]
MSLGVSGVGLAYLGTGLGILAFAYKPFVRPDTPGSKAFAVTVFGCALWPISLGFGILIGGETVSALAWSGRLVAPTVLSVGWFVLALRIGNGRTPPRWLIGALAGYVAVELLLLATNPVHSLAFDPAAVTASEGMGSDRNGWFWIQAAANYTLMTTATSLLAVEAIRSVGLRRRQSALLASAVVPAAIANVATIGDVVTIGHDLTPFGLVGSAAIMSIALYRAEFLDVVPIARQTALEELPHAVVILDGEGRVADYNGIASRYFDAGDGAGETARAFFANVPEEAVAALETGTAGHVQFALQTGDGERHFECTSSSVDRRDEHTGRVIVLRDVTERIRRERQLLEQNETLSEFADVVSHDIQGPLMEIRGSAGRAVRTGETTYAEDVLDAADRMDNLVEGLLDLARTGRRIDDPSAVSLEAVAERAWRSVWAPDVDLRLEGASTVEADPDRLQQLLENCIRNAAEHGRADDGRTNRGPELATDRAATSISSGEVLVGRPDEPTSVTIRTIPGGFAVDDDGPGVPPDRRDRVFDRGYTSAENGTGLGLAIVDQIATAHGWSAHVEESPEGGARFAFTGVTVLEEFEE